jgi:uroporphyrinogen-III decarboxylase
MLHSCGSIDILIEDIIAMGIDILDPIQLRAANMNPVSLKKRFGDRICFHGCIDTQYTFPHGAPEEVRQEVLDRMALFDLEGGFIAAPTHVLQPDVPIQNIEILYQTLHKKGVNHDQF